MILYTNIKYEVKLTNERFEIYAAVLFFVETVGTSPHPQGPPLPSQPGPGLVVREDHQLGELLHWSHRGCLLEGKHGQHQLTALSSLAHLKPRILISYYRPMTIILYAV